MIKQTLAATGLAVMVTTGALAETTQDADNCYFTQLFNIVNELPEGVHVKTTRNLQEDIIQDCEERTGTKATGISRGLTRLEIDNNRSWEFTTFE